MASGINTINDFVLGLVGQGVDWHKLTQEVAAITRDSIRIYDTVGIQTEAGKSLCPWKVFVAPNGSIIGEPFNCDTYCPPKPERVWDLVTEKLAGTGFTVERLGFLEDGTTWFFSIWLEELSTLARQGERFHLTISGSFTQKRKVKATLSGTRVVCMNTLLISDMGEEIFAIKGTKNADSRLVIAADLLEKVVGFGQIFNRTMEQLENTKCTIEAARQAYAGEAVRNGGKLTSDKLTKAGEKRESRALNTVDYLVEKFSRGVGNAGQTRADLLNGFTEVFTRGGVESSTKDPWLAIASSEFGGNSRRKSEFFQAISTESGFRKLRDEGKAALAAI